ncbi:MAG: DinB 2 domain-containing protein, partial [Bacteroidetes bacterium]|nr:DinB 2 domain-containing protein [Bacteroidota bacterium]
MQETNEQYVARISGYVEGQNHFKVFQSTVGKLQRLLKRVPASRLKKQPASDKWSVSEILGHLSE